MEKFDIVGLSAHNSKPKKRREFRKTVKAHDIIHAMRIHNRLRGVKHGDFLEIRKLSPTGG